MKTAVDFFIEQLKKYDVGQLLCRLHKEDIKQAKEIEKKQIIDAYKAGIKEQKSRISSVFMNKHKVIDPEQYYTKTFNQ